MDFVIYGADEKGKEARLRLRILHGTDVIGYLDTMKKGDFDGFPILSLDDLSRDCVVIISVYSPRNAVAIYKLLRLHGFHTIYWFINTLGTPRNRVGFLQDECINLANWGDSILPHLEIHISDKCNLNCRGCTHFSPLYIENGDDFEAQMNGLKKLKKLFSCVGRIDILGGEPLLNNNIKRYLIGIKKIFPQSYIQVFSNGLLIPSTDRSVFEVMERENISISISEYYPTHKMIEKISQTLDLNHVRYKIMGFDHKQKFNMPISIKNDSKYPHLCISNGCVTIKNDMIARCPTLMYINKLNSTFDVCLPEEGIYNIDTFKNGEQMLEKMEEEIPLCKHCIQYEINWEICGTERKLDDFAVVE